MKTLFKSIIRRFQPEDYVKRCRDNWKKGFEYDIHGNLYHFETEWKKLEDKLYKRWIEKYPDFEVENKLSNLIKNIKKED